ncbi:MAG TPA: hypothetical protein VGI00_05920 [Streptosporangiaceae bacterium]
MAAQYVALPVVPAVVLARFAAFRNGLYTRMEEVSFRTSMTVLGGVIAVAAVIAGVSVLMSQTPGLVRPVAVSPVAPTRSAGPSSAPPTPAASPSRIAPTASAPARTHAPAAPVHETTYPVTDEDSTPSRHVPAPTSGRGASGRQLNSAAVAAWAAWWRSRLGGLGHHGVGVHVGFGRPGFAGFGGHGAGHR